VVDLSRARDARRLREFEARCRAVDDLNRRALARLFQTGLVYTRAGARLGRDLLLAHQHLLRVGDLLVRIGTLGEEGWTDEADALYGEARDLLSRTTRLTARTGLVLARGT
jgi:phosphate uptake regulator